MEKPRVGKSPETFGGPEPSSSFRLPPHLP